MIYIITFAGILALFAMALLIHIITKYPEDVREIKMMHRAKQTPDEIAWNVNQLHGTNYSVSDIERIVK